MDAQRQQWNGFMAAKTTHNDNSGRTATTVERVHGCENDAQRQQCSLLGSIIVLLVIICIASDPLYC